MSRITWIFLLLSNITFLIACVFLAFQGERVAIGALPVTGFGVGVCAVSWMYATPSSGRKK